MNQKKGTAAGPPPRTSHQGVKTGVERCPTRIQPPLFCHLFLKLTNIIIEVAARSSGRQNQGVRTGGVAS